MHSVHTIDCQYMDQPSAAAAYLLVDGDRAAFVETNTNRAVPTLLATLQAQGLSPEQVEYVIITHVHLDHAGGAGTLMSHCPNATLLAHPRAAPHVIDPARIVAGATAVYGAARFAELYGTIVAVSERRVRALEDGATVPFGSHTLTFPHTRGHANHHFCVHDDGCNGVFTGDSFGILYPLLQRNGRLAFASTTPTDFDAEAAHQSIERILATGADRVFPTHFGEYTDLDVIAGQLHQQLDAYGALVDSADSSGRDSDELERFCLGEVRAMFDRLLADHGLAGSAAVAQLIAIDVELNGQGIVAAVNKRRYKRSKG